MKTKSPNIVLLSLLTFITIQVSAQSPDWTVNSNDFEYNMTLVASLNLDGEYLDSVEDKVAAFVNNEIRGVTNLVYEQSTERYYAYLTIFSNQDNEAISFKVYDESTGIITDISTALQFDINSHIGNLLQSYSIASPQLNNEVGVISLSVDQEVVNNVVIQEDSATLFLSTGSDIENINLIFELSEGAQFLYESDVIESGDNNLDFTEPVLLKIRSADETLLNDYEISIELEDINTNIIYAMKDAVCYRGGAIKVQYNSEGQIFELIKDEVIINSKNIITGELVFLNLEPATYTVKTLGLEKTITIMLKE